jgi:cytochrome b involved in lipid metabolism
MNIRDIPDDRMEMCAWWEDYSARYADRTEVQRKTFDEIALQVLATYPEDLRKLVLTATLAGMDDLYRNALGYPAPPPAVVDEVRTTLRVVGGFCASLPRIPWARSLQTFPLGYDLGRLGVSARSAYMPPMAGDERPKAERLRVNGGYPEHVRPLGAGEAGPFAELPIVDRAEVARHDTPEKAWMVIDGLVYDVTVFLQEHPGGARVLLPHLGKDATAAFARIGHSPEAKILMHNFRVARLADAVDREPASVPRPDRRRLAGAPEAEGWDETVDAVLAAVRAFEANRPRTPQGDEMARFPVQLPSHQRPQGAE